MAPNVIDDLGNKWVQKARGVSQKAFEMEVAYELDNIDVDLEYAHQVCLWYCNQYDMDEVKVERTQGRRRHGVYRPKNKFIYGATATIGIDRDGFTVSTVIHELAHHYQHSKLKGRSHDFKFKKAHELFLSRVGDMFWDEVRASREEYDDPNHPEIPKWYEKDFDSKVQTYIRRQTNG